MTRVLAALACVCLFLAPISAQEKKRPLTVEDIWKVHRVGQPSISPDGKWVAVEVSRYNMEDNSSTSDIWLLSSDGKTQKPLTAFKGKDSNPLWSPDGKKIAFVSKRAGDVAQIHVISPEGGEAVPVSDLPMGPSGLKWSHDSTTIYCVVQTWADTPDDESFKKKEKALKEDKVQALVIDDAMYRYWDHWIADGKRPVVFAVDIATKKHKNLFAGLKLHLPAWSGAASDYDVSPDGTELCFTADSIPEIGTDTNLDLYVLPLDKKGEPRNLTTDNPADDFDPVYSPDGKKIAFLRQTIKFFYADRQRIMILDRAGGKPMEATADLDRSCANVSWHPTEPRLFFEVEDAGYYSVFQATLGKQVNIERLTKGFSDHAPDLSRDGTTLAFNRNHFDFPAQVFVTGVKDVKPQRIDRFNDDLRKEWNLGPTKEVYYEGANGAKVQMWIVYPPDFDPAKKYPLLMMVHGGPHNAIPTDFHFRWNFHLLCGKGYVLACPNFHGSSGFGQKFTDSITGDMATLPYTDVMKATDFMEKEPYIDKSRTVAAGASYGGYMMAWLNGHTDRFKAMVCHAGVYNWHSMMASDIVRGRERRLGALPWQDMEKVDKQSPQRFSANFKTPTLVIHGEKDYRVPVSQGFEYFNTLRLKGVPTRLVYFPNENHWVMTPQASRLWHREFFGWLDRYSGPPK